MIVAIAAVAVLSVYFVRSVVMLVRDLSYDARRSVKHAQEADLADLQEWLDALRDVYRG